MHRFARPRGVVGRPSAGSMLQSGRIFDIYEGAGEIQRLIIARSILAYTGRDLR